MSEAKKPPNAGKGKPKGAVNKTTKALKEAILLAAEQVGADGKGKDGLTGYLREVAKSDVKAFAGLLGKVLPLQVTGADGGAIQQKVTIGADKFTSGILGIIARRGETGGD